MKKFLIFLNFEMKHLLLSVSFILFSISLNAQNFEIYNKSGSPITAVVIDRDELDFLNKEYNRPGIGEALTRSLGKLGLFQFDYTPSSNRLDILGNNQWKRIMHVNPKQDILVFIYPGLRQGTQFKVQYDKQKFKRLMPVGDKEPKVYQISGGSNDNVFLTWDGTLRPQTGILKGIPSYVGLGHTASGLSMGKNVETKQIKEIQFMR